MPPPDKIAFENLKKAMQVFLDFPEVETIVENAAKSFLRKILLSTARNGDRLPEEVLAEYLDAEKDTVDRLKLLIGFSGGSYEKFQRIYSLLCPNKSLQAIRKEREVRYRVAHFLLNPNSVPETIFIPPFIKKGFFLPKNWVELLQDKGFLKAIIFQKILPAMYSKNIGEALERRIRKIVNEVPLPYKKGQAEIVYGKEVDVAIPNTTKPKILIMASYQITTSSAQTNRANEQESLFSSILDDNRKRIRDKEKAILINIIDGGGWLSRENDLKKMWLSCDYCFACSQLQLFKEVLNYYQNHYDSLKKFSI